MKYVSLGAGPLLITSFLFAPLIGLTACGGRSSVAPAPTYTVSVSPQPASIPVNGTVTFTATTTPPGGEVFWGLVDEGNGVNLGSSDSQTGYTFTYTAPPTPPITTPGFEGPNNSVGSVNIRALVGGAWDQFNVVITAPSITTGFTSPNNTVALGKTLSVWAYAVGSTNNAITMQVNGITGGSTTCGTIPPVIGGFYGEYDYTAPATMPMTGNTVTITVISQADPTKSSSMNLTLTP